MPPLELPFDRYLRELSSQLLTLSEAQREAIRQELRTYLADAAAEQQAASNEPVFQERVIAQLGSSAEMAAAFRRAYRSPVRWVGLAGMLIMLANLPLFLLSHSPQQLALVNSLTKLLMLVVVGVLAARYRERLGQVGQLGLGLCLLALLIEIVQQVVWVLTAHPSVILIRPPITHDLSVLGGLLAGVAIWRRQVLPRWSFLPLLLAFSGLGTDLRQDWNNPLLRGLFGALLHTLQIRSSFTVTNIGILFVLLFIATWLGLCYLLWTEPRIVSGRAKVAKP